MNIEAIFMHVARLTATGLDLTDKVAVGALTKQIERELFPDIVPDRAYKISELKVFGFRRGRIYKARKTEGLVIRKNGRASYILGRDLLAWIDNAPTLGPTPWKTQPRDAVAAGAKQMPAPPAAPSEDRNQEVTPGRIPGRGYSQQVTRISATHSADHASAGRALLPGSPAEAIGVVEERDC